MFTFLWLISLALMEYLIFCGDLISQKYVTFFLPKNPGGVYKNKYGILQHCDSIEYPQHYVFCGESKKIIP